VMTDSAAASPTQESRAPVAGRRTKAERKGGEEKTGSSSRRISGNTLLPTLDEKKRRGWLSPISEWGGKKKNIRSTGKRKGRGGKRGEIAHRIIYRKKN